MKRNARVKVEKGAHAYMNWWDLPPGRYVEMDTEDAFYEAFIGSIAHGGNPSYIHIDMGDAAETWSLYSGGWSALSREQMEVDGLRGKQTNEAQLAAFEGADSYTLHVVRHGHEYPHISYPASRYKIPGEEEVTYPAGSIIDPTRSRPVLKTDDARMAVMKAIQFDLELKRTDEREKLGSVWLIARGLPKPLRKWVAPPFKNMVIYSPWVPYVSRGKK